MKKLLLLITATVSSFMCLWAEEEKSVTDWLGEDKSLYEGISGKDKKNKVLNIDLHMHGGFNLNHIGPDTKGRFHLREARLSIDGELTDWLSYRYRQKLNESNSSSGNMDHLPGSLDVLGLGIKFSEKWSMFLGKQAVSYGGIEYDWNPILVYDYSESLLSLHGFMTGVNFIYKPSSKHEIHFQVVNSRVKDNIDEEYGVGFRDTALPLMYSINWNATMSKVYALRWSTTLMSQAKGKQAYYFSLGNIVNLGKVNINLDLNFHLKDIDYAGVITAITGGIDNHMALNSRYQSVVSHINYRITPNWNIFGKGTFDISSVQKTHGSIEKGTYKTRWGYQGGVEYYPMEKSNLHFFLAYTGQKHNFRSKAKEYGVKNFSDNNIGVGFIYVLPIY